MDRTALLVGVFSGIFITTSFHAVGTGQTTVGVQSVIDQPVENPAGGPQALEGYTRLSHSRGTVRLALGTIGNVELNAHGDTTLVRSLQAGGVITNDGPVQQWSGLFLSKPVAGEGYRGSTNVKRYDYITFDNGWSIRPDGKNLLICTPANTCRPF
jgi:hypothetical protein